MYGYGLRLGSENKIYFKWRCYLYLRCFVWSSFNIKLNTEHSLTIVNREKLQKFQCIVWIKFFSAAVTRITTSSRLHTPTNVWRFLNTSAYRNSSNLPTFWTRPKSQFYRALRCDYNGNIYNVDILKKVQIYFSVQGWDGFRSKQAEDRILDSDKFFSFYHYYYFYYSFMYIP